MSDIRDAYLAAFDSYIAAMAAEGFEVRDVQTDEKGLLTWGAGDAHSSVDVERMEALYERHFKQAELAYVRQVFDEIYGEDRHGPDAGAETVD